MYYLQSGFIKLLLAKQSFKKVVLSKLALITISLAIGVVTILSLGDFYASFLRENKSLRNYATLYYYIYSVVYDSELDIIR